MKSNKKVIFVFVFIIIIILGIAYLFLSGKLFNNTSKNTIEPVVEVKQIEEKVLTPIVSDVVVKNVTSTGVTITWKTNLPTKSQILYGVSSVLNSSTKSYENSTPIDIKITTEHSIVLKNLQSKKKFFYQIISINDKNVMFTSDEFSFTTLVTSVTKTNTSIIKTNTPVVKVVTPVVPAVLSISSVLAKNITSTGANVEWKTNIPATSQVLYGIASGIYLSSSSLDSKTNTLHSVVLNNLLSNQKIYYQVVSVDSKGNKVFSKESTFTVATITISSAPKVEFTSTGNNANISISWGTNFPTIGKIIYGDVASASGSYNFNTPFDNALSLSHIVSINNRWVGNTKIYYRIISVDGLGVKVISNEYSFTSPVAYDFSEQVVSNSVVIKWKTYVATSGKVTFGTISGSYPLSSALSSSLTTTHSITITGLQSGTVYFYKTVSAGSGVTNTTSEERSFITL